MASFRAVYKTVDDLEIPTNVFLPDPATVRLRLAPVILILHGGAWIVGHAGMVSRDQVDDCLGRGWIVLAPEHRLCPGVTLLEGPMTDVRDLLKWVQHGGLDEALTRFDSPIRSDRERVLAMGTSSGGHLALTLCFEVAKMPLAVLDFYGTKHFDGPFFSRHAPLPQPQEFSPLFRDKSAILGGVSLEGQADSAARREMQDLRQTFIQSTISTKNLLQVCVPDGNYKPVDPFLNVHHAWPPTCLVHGNADSMLPISLSRDFEAVLREHGVPMEFIEVNDAPHTFVAGMQKGSETWNTQRKGFDFLEHFLIESYKTRSESM